MYTELSILVALILAVLFMKPLTQLTRRISEGEGFQSTPDPDADVIRPDDVSKGLIDLRQERDAILRVLAGVRDSNHSDPSNPSRSMVRVGMERLIVEIDRALEQEGRFLPASSMEAIIRAAHQNFRPL